MNNLNELPEAPASVTYSIESKNGFNALFTIRELTGLALIEKMGAIESKLLDLGYKPQVKGFAKKEKVYVEGKMCPKCKGRLVEMISKAGKKYHKCENGKWNSFTKTAEGCNFVDWLDSAFPVKVEPKEPTEDWTDTVDKI
jgi:hypothetical protein